MAAIEAAGRLIGVQSLAFTRSRKGEAEEMTPAQCRAARDLVGMSQFDFAGLASIPMALIADFEIGLRKLQAGEPRTLQRILEAAGVEFIGDVGVKLKGGK